MESTPPSPRRTTGLAHHASTAAFAASRSLTSHLRRHYHERYKARYPRYRLVFALDMFLIGFAVALIVFIIAVMYQSAQNAASGLDVAFRVGDVRASDVVPIEVRVHAIDMNVHENVVVTWSKPAWVDVISAEPKMSASGDLALGDFRIGEEKSIHLLAKIKTLPGESLSMAIVLHQAGFLGLPRYSTIEGPTWLVKTGALHVDLPVDATAIVNQGSLPLVVTNDGSVTSTMTLRLTATDGAPHAVVNNGESFFTMSDLAPHAQRVVFVDIGEASATSVHLRWELQDGAQAVASGEKSLIVAASMQPQVNAIGWIRGGDEATVTYRNGASANRLFVDHPQLRDAASTSTYRMYALAPDGGSVSIPLETSRATAVSRWSVVPIEDLGSDVVLGKRTMGAVAASIPFRAEARYYTASGDQIGIGPMPPEVGRTTSYWIAWIVGPTETDLTNVAIKTSLPPHVHATGRFASDQGGVFSSDTGSVSWVLPTLSATHGAVATFAFEVALDPSADQRGILPLLINKSAVSATDVQTNTTVAASAPAVTTDMRSAAQSPNDGIVR